LIASSPAAGADSSLYCYCSSSSSAHNFLTIILSRYK
jgi:hypothetical protein